MKKFEVIEIEYDKLEEDLRSNCEDLIEKNNILFNYDEEQEQYIAFVKFDPQRARSLGHKPRKSDSNSRLLRRKKKEFRSKKYGIFNDFPFKKKSPKNKHSKKSEKILIKGSKMSRSPKKRHKPKPIEPTEKTQADFHDSCFESNPKSRRKIPNIKGSVMYRPSHRGRSADLTRRINNLPEETSQRTIPKRKLKNNDNRGYTQFGMCF